MATDRCLWTDTAPPLDCPPGHLPERTDVAVVGGGYTGLSAARALARHGADVVLLEQRTLGWGASGRNGGFVLPGYQPDMEALARRHGLVVARAMFETSLEAVGAVERLVADESRFPIWTGRGFGPSHSIGAGPGSCRWWEGTTGYVIGWEGRGRRSFDVTLNEVKGACLRSWLLRFAQDDTRPGL